MGPRDRRHLSFGGRSGLDLLKEHQADSRPKLPVLVLSMHSERQFAVRALKAGAAGYVTKKVASEELPSAVRRVAAGGRWVTQEVAEQPDRRREMQPGHINCKPVVIDDCRGPHRARRPAEPRARGNGQMMGGLGIEPERQRANKCRIDHDVRIISTWMFRGPRARKINDPAGARVTEHDSFSKRTSRARCHFQRPCFSDILPEHDEI